jgi:hypothetical protein
MRLLTVIYSGRAPRSCEILWCQDTTTARELSSFLDRTAHHPNGRFTLLQVDLLAPTLQQIVLRVFLERRDPAASDQLADYNLHCVETGPNPLQSVSWIPVQNADELTEDVDLKESLRKWVYDGDFIKGGQLQCFVGPVGSGKTYQMRKFLASKKNTHHAPSL